MPCVACGAEMYLMRVAGNQPELSAWPLGRFQLKRILLSATPLKRPDPLVRLSFATKSQSWQLYPAPGGTARREFRTPCCAQCEIGPQAVRTNV